MKAEAKDVKSGWNSSLVCEEEFRALGQASKCHNAQFLSHTAQWHSMLTNGVLSDNFTTPLPTITPQADFTKARKLEDAVFDHTKVHDEATKFSLGWDLLDQISKKDPMQLMDFWHPTK